MLQTPVSMAYSMVSSPLAEAADNNQRRERAAIAAQACQTCRSRKSKCDEQRPKCGLCRRLNVECVYREPLPTKKDKTMVHILDALTRLEIKFDSLILSNGTTTPETMALGAQTAVSQSSNSSRNANRADPDYGGIELLSGHHHLTPSHRIVLWPSIYIHLFGSGMEAAADLQHILHEGTQWFIKLEMASSSGKLSIDSSLRAVPLVTAPSGQASPSHVVFPTLTVQRIQDFTDAYFDTFNIISPILDRDTFVTNVITPILQSGYSDGDPASVIALLVFALGQVALEGIFEQPISMFNDVPSGLRGGNAKSPPGIDIFNEARRRIGFVSTLMTLENVQIMLLQATYFATTSSHLDSWRSIMMASTACQLLIKCQVIDWQTHYGGMVKRAYWTCNLGEAFHQLDLGLPPSGIGDLEDDVPLPYFREGQEAVSPSSASSDESSHFQYHFLAMIALRRLISRIHDVVHECESSSPRLTHAKAKIFRAFSSHSDSTDEYRGPPVTVIREMARQLESWRSLLPLPLQWQDSDRFDFANLTPGARGPNDSLFSPDRGHVPIRHKYNLDIVTAQLRTRFSYARFMMYRPFVYKALHFPELITSEDAECCGLAIQSALLWPIIMAPPKNKKRLAPHLFAWTQNIIDILLILRMTTESECLHRICDEHVNRDEMQTSVTLMLEWLRDVKQVDAIAAWGWKILEPLYRSGL